MEQSQLNEIRYVKLLAQCFHMEHSVNGSYYYYCCYMLIYNVIIDIIIIITL